MSGEDFELKTTMGATRRIKFYRSENCLKNYVDSGNLQLCFSETPTPELQPGKTILKKLVNFYRQKQNRKTSPMVELDKSKLQKEFSDLSASYQELMNVKNTLKNAYENLTK